MKRHATWIVILSLLAGLPAAAGHRDRDREHVRWARIVRSTPIHERVRVVTPVRECRTERVSYERPRRDRHHRRHHSRTPALLGASIGGLVGSEIGHSRRDRRVATLMGALIGGSIGHDIGHRQGRRHPRHRDRIAWRDEERCETREQVSWERQVVGYDVDYRYRGRIYNTRLDHDPGRRMEIEVDVRPAH
jgi:uncharacterized protein YcfJ